MMSYLNHSQLESAQAYGSSPYLNPKDHPAERVAPEPPFICGCCQEAEVDEPGCWCGECWDIMNHKDNSEPNGRL
jgi:hypothetical protein